MMRCERISVERDGGVRRVEYPLSLVESFVDTYSLKPHVGELFDPRIGNQETHRPWWNGTQWQSCHEVADGADHPSAANQTRAPRAPEGSGAPESNGTDECRLGTEENAHGTR